MFPRHPHLTRVRLTIRTLFNKFLVQLNLPPQQIPNHLAPSDPDSVVECDEVHGGEEAVCETEWEHEGDPAPRILQSPTFRLHGILLHDAPNEVVHVSGVINLPGKCAGGVGGLTTGKDVEVVVCGVSAGVAFGADGCAKDDDVFGDTGV